MPRLRHLPGGRTRTQPQNSPGVNPLALVLIGAAAWLLWRDWYPPTYREPRIRVRPPIRPEAGQSCLYPFRIEPSGEISQLTPEGDAYFVHEDDFYNFALQCGEIYLDTEDAPFAKIDEVTTKLETLGVSTHRLAEIVQ